MCGAAAGLSVVGVAQTRQPVDGEEPAWIVAARQLAREAGRDAVRDERLRAGADEPVAAMARTASVDLRPALRGRPGCPRRRRR